MTAMTALYFAYGSNLGTRGLEAKGIVARRSEPARLVGWQLAFDLPSAFRRLEGGVANISPGEEGDEVHGAVHEIDASALEHLDVLETVGVLYERKSLPVVTYDGHSLIAEVYVGFPTVRDPVLRPSRRYLSLILAGATERGLESSWIDRLRDTQTHVPPELGPFVPPADVTREMDPEELAEHPTFIALYGLVFDVSALRPEHGFLPRIAGGADLTAQAVSFLGDGIPATSALTGPQIAFLHGIQHELAADYPIVARYRG